MLAAYDDIRSRIPEEPKWFDSNGVPRYDAFSPEAVPDIYANEAVLYRIQCQACGLAFDVADELSSTDIILKRGTPLHEQITTGSLHYGDPPRHGVNGDTGHLCAGDTMNCEDIRVLEYWRRESLDWERDQRLEISLDDAEADKIGAGK